MIIKLQRHKRRFLLEVEISISYELQETPQMKLPLQLRTKDYSLRA